ncbi:uncharacterized protein LOC131262160 [Anopheles coustani]|uniref:uncharacterized protein LOC131262160 n=1 Tax=Anopheles coustani TaxID=139045 RepID=UPI002658DC30|nr:uncharacterized protein LOC131262160 [Anopheles coustani]
MSSLQSILRKKYLGINKNSKNIDLPTDSEYQHVSDCNLKDLIDIASTASILEEICEGEKCLTVEYYDQQEKKYHRYVAKINRKVKEKPTLPPIVEVEVVVSTPAPTPALVEQPVVENASDRTVATLSPHEAIDAIRESSPTESRGQLQDPYQLAEKMLIPNPSTMALDGDEHFGSKDADGAREFLELCTGTDHPPMSLTDASTQELVLAELGIPRLPLNDNFQEIDLRGINMPFLSRPLSASTPLVETTVPRRTEPPALATQAVGPIADPSGMSGDGQLLNALPERACSVDLAPVAMPNNVSNVGLPAADIPHGVPTPPAEEIIHPQPTVQARGVLTRSGSSSSGSTVEAPVRVPRGRRVTDFTRRLPRLVDVWPPPRRNFDIFSYHNESNLFPMIDNVLNQLAQLRQQFPTPLVDQLVMRAAEVPTATGDTSIAYRSNDQGSRDPLTTPGIEVSDPTQRKAQPAELSQVLDSQGLALTSAVVANVSTLMNTLSTIDGKILEVSDQYRLPSLITDTPVTDEPNVAIDAPIRIGAHVVQGAATELMTPQEPTIGFDSGVGIPTEVVNPDTIQDSSASPPHIDSMFLDIFIIVQCEMCLHKTDEDFVPIQRLIQLLRITTRIRKAKLIINVILLQQARLLVVSRAEDNSILGVRTNFPTDLVDGSFC